MFRIIFGCDPKRVDVLTEALFQQIEDVKLLGLDDEHVNKAKEIQKNEYDKNIRENKYWLGELQTMLMDNSNAYKLIDYNNVIDNFDTAHIKLLANKYLNTENYVKAVLYPEE